VGAVAQRPRNPRLRLPPSHHRAVDSVSALWIAYQGSCFMQMYCC
jgi:hypothetical protein